MPLAAGSRLGPYEILSPLGAGGMGEVYEARDTRLDRSVALKVSKGRFTARFESEARAIAALNHPHICTLHDVGPNYLVMELIEGSPLKGPLPVQTAVKYAGQICDALDAAHAKGITHRDLKPANILVTKQGVKLLDFGLAKQGGPLMESDLTQALTQQGEIVGTLNYMSPEQLQSKPADTRSDVFALGLVLYEMLTGKAPFTGANPASVIAGILERPAPSVGAVAPASLDRVIQIALAKEPDQRWQSARDFRSALDVALSSQAAAPAGTAVPRWPVWIATAMCAITAALAFVHFREAPPDTRAVRSWILPPGETSFDIFGGLNASAPAVISPDGRQMVFGTRDTDGKSQLWVQALDALNARPLPGTQNAAQPFWSPDSKLVGFFADDKVKKINVSGGPPTSLCDFRFSRGGGTWNQEGVILLGSGSGPLLRISASGGAPSAVTKEVARWPSFLPGGKRFLYSVGSTIRLGSLDGTESKQIADALSEAIYSQGHLLYMKEDTLMAHPFDLGKLAVTGEPIPIADAVYGIGAQRLGLFSVSGNGALLFKPRSGVGRFVLTWFDRAGKRLGVVGEPGEMTFPNLSPDQNRAAVSVVNSGMASLDTWVYNLSRGVRTRFTTDSGDGNHSSVWSPDGQTIAYSVEHEGKRSFFRRPANMASGEQAFVTGEGLVTLWDWSRDGKFLLATIENPRGLAVLPVAGDHKPVLVVDRASTGQFSPDGKWIAFTSMESQRREVYVVPFPGPGGRVQVSSEGGDQPRWRRDGKELFYMSLGRIVSAEVDGKSGTFEVGTLRTLFGGLSRQLKYQYDVSADGQRFLVIAPPEVVSAEPFMLVQNWAALLKK